MKYVLIENNVVINLIELEEEDVSDYTSSIPYTAAPLPDGVFCDIGYTATFVDDSWVFAEPS